MKEADTAIMMVTYNRLELTKQMLENLYKNTKRPFYLVIIDNGSSDGTKEFLLSGYLIDKQAAYVCHFNNENQGIAIGRSQGLFYANKEFPDVKWFATVDNDIEVPENWLNNCIEIMETVPGYGMIGVNMEGVEYPLVSKNGKVFQHKAQGNLGTACMVFPKKLHKMIGYFNTSYKFYAHEDADYGFRARLCGFQLGYIQEKGAHVGEGENDVGEYREFKNKWHKENLSKFHNDCRLYIAKKKPVYISFNG